MGTGATTMVLAEAVVERRARVEVGGSRVGTARVAAHAVVNVCHLTVVYGGAIRSSQVDSGRLDSSRPLTISHPPPFKKCGVGLTVDRID